jgi:uncharacterized protein (DUF305 family)
MKAGWLLALVVAISTVASPAPQHSSLLWSGSGTVSPEWLALQQSMQKMHAAMMSAQPSNNDDINFVSLMLPHHQAAVEMAKTQLLYGTDPQIRRLAQEIVTDQQSEIELMQLWLKKHKP